MTITRPLNWRPTYYSKMTDAASGMEYVELPNSVSDEEVVKHCHRIRKQLKERMPAWTPSLNSEWLVRHYLSLKLILSATLMLSSLRYAREKNLRVVEPYLMYYSLFNCARAFLLTMPSQSWGDGKLFSKDLNHTKVLNVTSDEIRLLSQSAGEPIRSVMREAKAVRELFSYRFPARGFKALGKDRLLSLEMVETSCRLLAEVAQLNSELLQVAGVERGSTTVGLDADNMDLEYGFTFDSEVFTISDDDDSYRIGYFVRKQPFPMNLVETAREGLVEDFFGAWDDDDRDEGQEDFYRTYRQWNLLLSPI